MPASSTPQESIQGSHTCASSDRACCRNWAQPVPDGADAAITSPPPLRPSGLSFEFAELAALGMIQVLKVADD